MLQQYGSTEQICEAHGSQLAFSRLPVLQIGWAQVLPPQLWPQMVATSLTQMLSHAWRQQYGSAAQTLVAQGSQPLVSGPPELQIGCEH